MVAGGLASLAAFVFKYFPPPPRLGRQHDAVLGMLLSKKKLRHLWKMSRRLAALCK